MAPHLPDELLLQIFEKLALPSAATISDRKCRDLFGVYYKFGNPHEADWKQRLSTLSAITKASQRFRRIATPVLYHTYPGPTTASLPKFHQTIINRPGLATLVKELVVESFKSTPLRVSELINQPSGLSRNLVQELLSAETRHYPEAFAPLLLFYYSNVEVLDFTDPAE